MLGNILHNSPRGDTSLRQLLRCSCKKGCRGKCKCPKAALQLMAVCYCGGLCASLNENTLHNDVVKHIPCNNKSCLLCICMDCMQSNTNFWPFCKMAAISTLDKSVKSLNLKVFPSSLAYSVTVCQMSCFYRKRHNHFTYI